MRRATSGGENPEAAAVSATPNANDPRTRRTRQALSMALADEIEATGDLTKVTVTAVARRAGVTRRTFYSHYRDIPDLVRQIEEVTLEELTPYVERLTQTTLDELQDAVANQQPCPGARELLTYCKERGHYLAALLGDGGDPAFSDQMSSLVRSIVSKRALVGLDVAVVGSLFDYYLTYAISAEVGVLVRWLCRGARESVELMACVMTMLVFVRPGDLYDRKVDFDARAFGLTVLNMTLEEAHE